MFPLVEKLVRHLQIRNKCKNVKLFAGMVDFYLGTIPSALNITITGYQRQPVPINNYVVNLATSGFGKGVSKNFIENEILEKFIDYLTTYLIPVRSVSLDQNPKLKYNPSEFSYQKLTEMCNQLGSLPYSFDNCTVAALKQLNQKVILLGLGSLNLIVDEIGYNFKNIEEGLSQYLELYDLGIIGQKVLKSHKDANRFPTFKGFSPANMLLFGTPHQLLNIPTTRELFINWLASGGARRSCIYLEEEIQLDKDITPEVEYSYITNPATEAELTAINDYLYSLASDLSNLNKSINLSKEGYLRLKDYQNNNQITSKIYSTKEEDIANSAIKHGHWRALKLAGTYAFIDGANEITEAHVNYAIEQVEVGNKDIVKVVANIEPHIKICKYLTSTTERVSLNQLSKFVPELKASKQKQSLVMELTENELFEQGYLLNKVKHKGIEHYEAQQLKLTNLEQLHLSLSDNLAQGYEPKEVAFDDLVKLGQLGTRDKLGNPINVFYWCNHTFLNQHRNDENTIEGFNLIVIDVDGGLSLEDAKTLLANYMYVIYTTKRHTEALNRFRIILPSKYTLSLNKEAYSALFKELAGLFPFDFDKGSGERARAWSTNAGEVFTNKGKLFDPLPYLTERDSTAISKVTSIEGVRNWIKREIVAGNRNNLLFYYCKRLEQNGANAKNIRKEILSLNNELTNPLTREELNSTILRNYME